MNFHIVSFLIKTILKDTAGFKCPPDIFPTITIERVRPRPNEILTKIKNKC